MAKEPDDERHWIVRTVVTGRETRYWEDCHEAKDNYKIGKRYVEYHIVKTVGPYGHPDLTLDQAKDAVKPYDYKNGRLISVEILGECYAPVQVKVPKSRYE
jgi:hypothetical protein